MTETKWKMGDVINIPGQNEKFILARMNNYKEQKGKDQSMFHFQFIGTTTGNRYSNNIITHNEGIDHSIILEEFEILYLLEEELTKDQIREYHEKGPEWDCYDPIK